MQSRRLAGVRVVLFDLDGTLADTAPDLGGALNRVRVRHGLQPLPLAQLRPVASAGARGLLGAGMDKHPGDADYEALRDEFLAEYEAALDRDSRLFDGARALLDELVARGLRWGVVTNKAMRFTAPVVRALGLGDAAVLIAGDSTPHAKPHPGSLLQACAQLGVAPADCVYVGDDLRDVQAAHAAGMAAVVAGWGYLGQASAVGEASSWGAEALIDTPNELLDLLD